MGGAKKKNLNSYARRLTNNYKRPGEFPGTKTESTEPEGVTQILNRLRAEEARKKGLILSWSDFQTSVSSQQYLNEDPTQNFRPLPPSVAGPKPPNSWVASSINRPNGATVNMRFQKKSLYTHCLNFIFTDFIATKKILERLEFLPCRIKKDLILVILPRLSNPDILLSSFKDLSYESLSFENCNITSTALIKFLDLVEDASLSFGYLPEVEGSSYLSFLTRLNLSGCLALDTKIIKHLSTSYPQLLYLNLDRTFTGYSEELLSSVLNLLGSGLIHLRFLSLNNNAWISSKLIFHVNWKTGYPSIETLSLQSCQLPDSTELKDWLKQSRPRLKLLV
ncbi:hypothetical protein DSO57_1036384 [Entomophthora muscae]|uniref:Uncharacterized protein n=1 Tax=Entomophthora muscae TaxID=34485 RepID=A0ACC2S166_9FUNG|nr:hypothetical protein DSO57_1036384 [Entomophthora muscae]